MYPQKHAFETRYRWFTGSFAWILHRVTGLALVLYLALHIYSVSFLAVGSDAFNAVMKAYEAPAFKIGEVLVWGAFLYHALNGLRVVWMDLGKGSLFHKKLFAGVLVLAGLLFVAGAYGMLRPTFGW
jgi:succinate dehydrogenase / fumarate reductase cytochrome b subunit